MRVKNADLGHTSQTSTAVIPSRSETPPTDLRYLDQLLSLDNASPRPGRRRTGSLSYIFNIPAEGDSGDVVRTIATAGSSQQSPIDKGVNEAPPIPTTLSGRTPSDFETLSSNGGHVGDDFAVTRTRRRRANKQDQGGSNSGGTDLGMGRRKSGKSKK